MVMPEYGYKFKIVLGKVTVLLHYVCTKVIITLVKHCLKLGLLAVREEGNLKATVIRAEEGKL